MIHNKNIRSLIREILLEVFNTTVISIQDAFNLIDYHDSYRDLYPGYSEDENEYEEDYYYSSREEAEIRVGDVIEIFNNMPNPIPVYRSIKVDSIDDIDYDLLGDSWSFDKQSAINFAKNQAGGNVLISGFVKKENVDWEDTIRHYFQFSETFTDYDENEIKIPNSEDDVFDIKVEYISKKNINESNYKNNFVGIHCSPKLFSDDYDGKISEEYYGSFANILEVIQNEYPEAKEYLNQIDTFDYGLDLYGESADLIFEIESFFIDNNIEWIYVATEALTKYGDNCYNVYFNSLDSVYRIDDELVDNASIYIYNASNNRPILKKISSENKKSLVRESFTDYTSFDLSEEELKNIAKWGLEGPYSSSGCWDDSENIEEAIKCVVDDFKLFLSRPYPKELGNIPNNPIIYRLIRLKSISELRKDSLGISWFSNPEQYKNDSFFQMLDYLRKLKTSDGEIYLIKAQTSISNIDIPNTLWQRSTQWYENEIVLKNDSSSLVKILDIKKIQNY